MEEKRQANLSKSVSIPLIKDGAGGIVVVLLLVAFALLAGALTTAAIIRRLAATDPLPPPPNGKSTRCFDSAAGARWQSLRKDELVKSAREPVLSSRHQSVATHVAW